MGRPKGSKNRSTILREAQGAMVARGLLGHEQDFLGLHGLIVGSRKHQLDFVRDIDAAGIKPVIDRSFDLDEIADAFRYEARWR
jgi:hypothetical protein